MKKYMADSGLLLVGILWGLGFVFVKIGLNGGLEPFYLLTIRFLGGFLILYLIIKIVIIILEYFLKVKILKL